MINNDDKEFFDLHFSLKNKKKIKKNKKDNNDNKKQYNYYEYDLLLNRLHNNLKQQYPELNQKNNNTKKIPQIRSMISNKKTYWLNLHLGLKYYFLVLMKIFFPGRMVLNIRCFLNSL